MNAVVQREIALKRANLVRSVTATLKRAISEQDIRTGKLMAWETISDPPAELGNVRVEELLRSIQGWGAYKADRAMKAANVSPRRRVGDLTDHERLRLEVVLRG